MKIIYDGSTSFIKMKRGIAQRYTDISLRDSWDTTIGLRPHDCCRCLVPNRHQAISYHHTDKVEYTQKLRRQGHKVILNKVDKVGNQLVSLLLPDLYFQDANALCTSYYFCFLLPVNHYEITSGPFY